MVQVPFVPDVDCFLVLVRGDVLRLLRMFAQAAVTGGRVVISVVHCLIDASVKFNAIRELVALFYKLLTRCWIML
jgi:hypothetical protein